MIRRFDLLVCVITLTVGMNAFGGVIRYGGGAGGGSGDVLKASTQTFTGTNTFTSPRSIVVAPVGDVGIGIDGTAEDTGGAVMFDVSASTGFGLTIFNNANQTEASWTSLLNLISTGPTYGGYFLRIFRNSDNSNGDIRIDSPVPNIEFVETDQVSPTGKFEIGINGGIGYIATRNAADDSFERVVEFQSYASGSPGIVLQSTASLKFSDTALSWMAFRAPATLGASWTHELWSTPNNTGKTLTQTADGGARPLAWVNTFATSKTEAALKSDSPDAAGRIYYCSDCSVDAVVVSTGTGAGAVVRLTARTTAID